LATKIKAKKSKEENGVTGSMILITFFVTALVLLLTLPNIYLDNQIYYESRDIAHLQRVKITLEEEQSLIKTKLEEIHAKESLLNYEEE
jgi:competence protein ComGC